MHTTVSTRLLDIRLSMIAVNDNYNLDLSGANDNQAAQAPSTSDLTFDEIPTISSVGEW